MKKAIVLYVIGFFLSWVAITGMVFATLQTSFPDKSGRKTRQHLGFSIAWGCLASTLWPVTLPAVYLITGFAQDGWRISSLFASQAWAGDCPKATIEQYGNEDKFKVTAWKEIWEKTPECLEREEADKRMIPPGSTCMGCTTCSPMPKCVPGGNSTVFNNYSDAVKEYLRIINGTGSKWRRVI